eukprot:4480648-Amphidinium_carterae.1
MKMTLLIQNIQGDIKSHMLMNYNLQTANFDDSCTQVEDYYRNVYIDNSGGQIAGLRKPKKPWPPWKRNNLGRTVGEKECMTMIQEKEEKTKEAKTHGTKDMIGKDEKEKDEEESLGKEKAKETTATTTTEANRKATTEEKGKTK